MAGNQFSKWSAVAQFNEKSLKFPCLEYTKLNETFIYNMLITENQSSYSLQIRMKSYLKFH